MIDTDPATDEADSADGGWGFVARSDGAARLLGTLLDLDADETYTRSEIADRSGVPLKTLYLNGLLDDCVDLGLLAETGPAGESQTETETRYRIADCDLLAAAASFDEAYRDQRG